MAGKQNRHFVRAVLIAIVEIGGEHHDRIIQKRGTAFIDALHLLDQIGELLHMELIGLEVHRFKRGYFTVVRKIQVQRAGDALQKLEVHLREIVVEHQRRHTSFVHLETQYRQVHHQLHVIRTGGGAT